MENIIFEEVNNKRTKYIDLPELIKGAIDFQPCCRELCERKIKWHFDQKEILYNYVILSNDEILWWCSKILYTEHAKIKRFERLARNSENINLEKSKAKLT